eukprot:TRINITY_DN8518_c0_g1_i4.p1 TRINITY_DN8518_c0_g1~~TRINITY_DN8518_c0_g1_i4.p1  ORF type:complete len:1051 (-),score=124.08 TRINITY_DN8518_c0_g1_i4:56-3148(-)
MHVAIVVDLVLLGTFILMGITTFVVYKVYPPQKHDCTISLIDIYSSESELDIVIVGGGFNNVTSITLLALTTTEASLEATVVFQNNTYIGARVDGITFTHILQLSTNDTFSPDPDLLYYQLLISSLHCVRAKEIWVLSTTIPIHSPSPVPAPISTPNSSYPEPSPSPVSTELPPTPSYPIPVPSPLSPIPVPSPLSPIPIPSPLSPIPVPSPLPLVPTPAPSSPLPVPSPVVPHPAPVPFSNTPNPSPASIPSPIPQQIPNPAPIPTPSSLSPSPAIPEPSSIGYIYFIDPPFVVDSFPTKVLILTTYTEYSLVIVNVTSNATSLFPSFTSSNGTVSLTFLSSSPGIYTIQLIYDEGIITYDHFPIVPIDNILSYSLDPVCLSSSSDTIVSITGIGIEDWGLGGSFSGSFWGDGVVSGGAMPVVFTNLNSIFEKVDGVSLLNSTLKFRVSPGHAVGTYTVLVASYSGYIGKATLSVYATIPRISSIYPSTILGTSAGVTVDVNGINFSIISSFSTLCQDIYGNQETVTATLGTVTSSSIRKLTLRYSGANYLVCNIRVTNPDGAYSSFSSVTIKNKLDKGSEMLSSSPMNSPRKNFGFVSARTNHYSRFLYAIGGENSTTLLNSIEFASVDLFGRISNWNMMATGFIYPITNHSVVSTGKSVYILGGKIMENSSLLSSKKVYRADILDDLNSPQVNINVIKGNTTFLVPGYWHYQVSIVYSSGVESLPSLITSVLILNNPHHYQDISIRLTWPNDANAVQYNIYRNIIPILNSSDPRSYDYPSTMLFIKSVDTNSFVDDGTAFLVPKSPVVYGSLGVWEKLTDMSFTREGNSAIALQQDPSKWIIYYIGGNSATMSYESTTIYTNVSSTILSWKYLVLYVPVIFNGAIVKYSGLDVSNTVGQTYVYMFPGTSANGTIYYPASYTFSIQSDNLNLRYTANDTFPQPISGYCGVQSAGNFFFLGGGNPQSQALNQILTGTDPGVGVNIKNTTATLGQARRFHRCVKESGMLFIAGGITTDASVTNTIEQTIT